jgi:hypothetical protein
MRIALSASVGRSGVNQANDVKLVKALINIHRRANDAGALPIDHTVSTGFLDAIGNVQRHVAGITAPDLLVSAGGQTFRALIAYRRSRQTVQAITAPARGRLTWDAEGTEGGAFHSRVLHVPSSASGLTIGRGYDMKHRGRPEIHGNLSAAGVPPVYAEKLSHAGGLAGAEAERFVIDRDLLDFEISPAAQLSLFMVTYTEHVKLAKSLADGTFARTEYGRVDWQRLEPAILDMLVDLRYRGDYTRRSMGFLQKHVVNNDLAAFAREIENVARWPGVPTDRRNRRIAFIDRAVAAASAQVRPVTSSPRR